MYLNGGHIGFQLSFFSFQFFIERKRVRDFTIILPGRNGYFKTLPVNLILKDA